LGNWQQLAMAQSGLKPGDVSCVVVDMTGGAPHMAQPPCHQTLSSSKHVVGAGVRMSAGNDHQWAAHCDGDKM